ncbi:cob(I)yrinic acid a,c-diamide adenosyltransferase [Colwellia sp. MT41]|uniref:Corrinoid adenosyltransferase n=1 Tax=Colwellia marinimaniae TaxID=1513592 RepID=A0ABQ0MR03_9GAMM|nr:MULTISPECIES: cob(I)yrinic acid a,c-diamide adenosyltransferase [Colwellia]ALO34095.1 cob(I)yrinic acid a,c-diamide adenosyltransferase [Colwellia sp. MT41]GAW94806.1 cob(I)alamin adenosyltransferase/cobinamide ATP-dependent adenosyltransferase [Colwellia marinimaniae]
MTDEKTTDHNITDKHQQRMQKMKEKVDARIESATEERGILIVITGNGKGKSTSGFGTVARAVGHGLNAAVAQFIKGTWACGERQLLENAGVKFSVMGTGFTWNTQDKEKDIAAAQQVWLKCKELLSDTNIDLVLLDEMTYMLSYKYIDLDEVITALNNRPKHQHVIITGRACHRAIIELADTVSEIKSIKHAFDSGIKAQKGIDW